MEVSMTMTTCPATSTSSVATLRAALTRSSQAGLSLAMLQEIAGLRRWTRAARDFPVLAHPHQEAPAAANNGGAWTTWLVLGGRGAGKTRLGAEWVRALAHGTAPYAARRHRRIALVGESEHDVRAVMIEGVSGLLRISPRSERPVWMSSRRLLEWANGAVAQVVLAEDPGSLGGPQFGAAWCDSLCNGRVAAAAV